MPYVPPAHWMYGPTTHLVGCSKIQPKKLEPQGVLVNLRFTQLIDSAGELYGVTEDGSVYWFRRDSAQDMKVVGIEKVQLRLL